MKNMKKNYIKITPMTRDEFEKSSRFDRNLREAYEIGDEVILRGGSSVTDILKVVGIRRMFGSNLMAYEVEFPNGEVAEYDETQLSLNPKTIDMDKVFMKGKMSDEEIEDLETRADDHFSEPLKEGYALNPEEVELMTSLRNQIDQGVLNSKQKDSFVGMLDGILNGYDVFNGDLEDYYNKNMKGTNPENDPFNINEELEIEEEDHSMFNSSILTAASVNWSTDKFLISFCFISDNPFKFSFI